MLQDWGIVHAIVYDVATHSVLMLVPLDNRLTASVWLLCNMLAAQQHGLPDLCAARTHPALPALAIRMCTQQCAVRRWTTDKGGETAVTAFMQRLEALQQPRPQDWPIHAHKYCHAAHPHRLPWHMPCTAAPAQPAESLPRAAGSNDVRRYLRSSRQSGVERFNGEINVKVNLALKLVFLYMEHSLGILDRTIPEHLGAIQALGVLVLQHADALLMGNWDVHVVRSATRDLGRPADLRASMPHPGGQRVLSAGVDYVARYEAATGRRLRRTPRWRDARDPLSGQPGRQAARLAAVMARFGSVALTWTDVLHNTGRARFIPAYLVYLSYY